MSWGTLLKTALLAAVVTIGANVALSLAARPVLGIPPEFEPVSPLAATIATSMYMVMGIVALLLVARFAKARAATVYWVLATIALLVSFIPNVNLARDSSDFPGATTAGMVFLAVQHVVAFALFVPWVTSALKKARPSA